MGKYAREQSHGSPIVAVQQRGQPTTDIEQRLREAADEMRAENQNGWPVVCDMAADEIASLRSTLEEAEGALKAAREFIADEFNDDAYEEFGEWLSPEARAVHKQLCEAEATLASLREADHA